MGVVDQRTRCRLAAALVGTAFALAACGGSSDPVASPSTSEGSTPASSGGSSAGSVGTSPGSGTVRPDDAEPVVTEVASGFARINDIEVDPDGVAWITDANNSALIELAAAGPVTHYTGEQTSTDPESEMSGLAIESDGTVWFATRKGISRLDPTTDVAELVVPAASTDLTGPIYRLALDPDDELFIGDVGQDKIFELDGTTLTHVAGAGAAGGAAKSGAAVDGTALTAVFGEIRYLAVGADGTIYVADDYTQRVHEVTPDGVVRTFAGGGAVKPVVKGVAAPSDTAPTALDLETPYSVWLVGETVYVLDSYDSMLLSLDPDDGLDVVVAPGQVNGGTSTRGASGPDGEVYVVVGGSTVVQVT